MPVVYVPLYDRFRNLYGYLCRVGTNAVILRLPIPRIWICNN